MAMKYILHTAKKTIKLGNRTGTIAPCTEG